jgi:hypothetical protein
MALTEKLEAQGNSVPSATAIQLPPKKPAQSHNYYLRARIRYILANLDSIKPSRLRGKVQDRLRELVHELRNSKGFASWWAIIFGGLCLGLIALIAVTHMPKVVVYQAPSSISPIGDTFQILQKGADPNHWQMRRLHYERNALVSSLDFWTTTCDSTPLSPGETLTWLSYEDRGKCWSVSDKALGYTFLRDDKGNAILAPNCYWKDDVLAECKGVPKW